jgi:hypothetical protein
MSALEIGLIVSGVLLVLLAVFASKIRRSYLSARNKMRVATERRRARRKSG